jgi:hypothetical protein
MSLKVERSKPSTMMERAWVGGMDCFGQSFGVSLRLDGGVGRFALKTLSGSSSWFGTRWAPDVGDQTTCLDPKQGRRKTRRCETVAREDDGNEDLESARGGL